MLSVCGSEQAMATPGGLNAGLSETTYHPWPEIALGNRPTHTHTHTHTLTQTHTHTLSHTLTHIHTHTHSHTHLQVWLPKALEAACLRKVKA